MMALTMAVWAHHLEVSGVHMVLQWAPLRLLHLVAPRRRRMRRCRLAPPHRRRRHLPPAPPSHMPITALHPPETPRLDTLRLACQATVMITQSAGMTKSRLAARGLLPLATLPGPTAA
jgi:hypothetical protein